MSALIGHAKAARIIGHTMSDLAKNEDIQRLLGEPSAKLLMVIGQSYITAAGAMEQAMREEATGREDVP